MYEIRQALYISTKNNKYLRKTPQDAPCKEQLGFNFWKSSRHQRPHQPYKEDNLITTLTKKMNRYHRSEENIIFI